MKDNDKIYPLVRNLGVIITIPMVFVVGPVIGFLIGTWVDLKWNLDPWGKTVFSLLGFVASVKQVIEFIKRTTSNEK